MNNRKFIKILIMSVLFFVTLSIIFIPKCNAAIESKSGVSRHINVNVSDCFQYCYDMRYPGSSLGNNNLDPHLAKATDWGITSYLSVSNYGAVKSIWGPAVTINGTDYNTTTGNATGVMNFGDGQTFTASYLEGSSSNGYRTNLYLEQNSRLVDVINGTNDAEHNIGMVYGEVKDWGWNSGDLRSDRFPNLSNPIGTKIGVITNICNSEAQGFASQYIAYRPVLWN